MPEEVKEEEKTTDAGPATQEKTLKVMCLGEDLGEFTEADLCVRSEYFRSIFKGSFRESQENLVDIEPPHPPTIRLALALIKTEIVSGITVESFTGLLRNFYYLTCEELCKRMAELLMYSDSQSFNRMCDDLDFTSYNVPSDFIALLVALRPNCKANVNKLDFDAMRVRKIHAVLCWSRLLNGVPEDVHSMVDLWNFPSGNEIALARLDHWWKAFPSPMASIHSLVSLHIQTLQRELAELQRKSENEYAQLQEKSREEKKKLQKQLDVNTCIDCREKVPVFFEDYSKCHVDHHPGDYKIREGWTCCKEQKKKSPGCQMMTKRHEFSRFR